MNTIIRNSLILCIVIYSMVILAGCHVDVTTTSFYAPEYKSSGKICVIASTATVDQSLEFSAYRKIIETKLMSTGYTITRNISDAEYIAIIAYGIDEGQTGVESVCESACNNDPLLA